MIIVLFVELSISTLALGQTKNQLSVELNKDGLVVRCVQTFEKGQYSKDILSHVCKAIDIQEYKNQLEIEQKNLSQAYTELNEKSNAKGKNSLSIRELNNRSLLFGIMTGVSLLGSGVWIYGELAYTNYPSLKMVDKTTWIWIAALGLSAIATYNNHLKYNDETLDFEGVTALLNLIEELHAKIQERKVVLEAIEGLL